MAHFDLSVRAFRPEDADAFAQLNRRWIEELFGIEKEDERVLNAPQATIVAPGGHIAIAEIGDEVVGTGALMVPHNQLTGHKTLELVKMATAPAAQGNGVGAAILAFLTQKARADSVDTIWLETNSKLGAATRLYERAGFKRLSNAQQRPTPYARCNLQMVLEL
ncbi:MAG: GNAT family N-acetyltransferase [Pseudomonadota bacterium]